MNNFGEHYLEYLGGGRYRRTSYWDSYSPNSRLRTPQARSSRTDRKGAKAFARKWKLKIPTILDVRGSQQSEVAADMQYRLQQYMDATYELGETSRMEILEIKHDLKTLWEMNSK